MNLRNVKPRNAIRPLMITMAAAILAVMVIMMGGCSNEKKDSVGAATDPHTYATVHYDGGSQVIGEILEEKVITNVTIHVKEKNLISGSIQNVIQCLENNEFDYYDDNKYAAIWDIGESSSVYTTYWPLGVGLLAEARMKWVGSENSYDLLIGDFTLIRGGLDPKKVFPFGGMGAGMYAGMYNEIVTHNVKKNKEKLLSSGNIIDQLKEFDKEVKSDGLEKIRKKVLTFGPSPKN
ncbi:MAG: hypothetical protein FWE89_03270 [Syntrophaceae bacterium]|nr:hypothetical protein [Syntrophaceae bacterium]